MPTLRRQRTALIPVRSTSKRPDRARSGRLAPVVALLTIVMGSLVLSPSVASAHAELIETSPKRSSTVGGEFTEIALQFVGLRHPGDHEVLVLDPLGNEVEVVEFEQDFNRLIITIDPLSVEGDYIVSYQTDGIDGDLNTDSYTFAYDQDADAPAGIEHHQETPGVDWVTIGLVITTVVAFLAWLLYVVKRLRAPQPEASPEGSADSDQIDEEHQRLAGTDVGLDSVVTKRKVRRDNK